MESRWASWKNYIWLKLIVLVAGVTVLYFFYRWATTPRWPDHKWNFLKGQEPTEVGYFSSEDAYPAIATIHDPSPVKYRSTFYILKGAGPEVAVAAQKEIPAVPSEPVQHYDGETLIPIPNGFVNISALQPASKEEVQCVYLEVADWQPASPLESAWAWIKARF